MTATPPRDGEDLPLVLLIEDDEDVISLLVQILELDGFAVDVARDGLEGLVKLRSGRPDLALLDIMMPDVSGVRVLEQLIEEGDGRLDVPVIVITGSPEGAGEARLILGADDVFTKPFDPDQLIARMRVRLDRE
jgi:DNA-binding response OmpR family regulator